MGVRGGLLSCEGIAAGFVGSVAGVFVGSSLLASLGCSVPGCSSPAVERVEVAGAAVRTDSGVGSDRHCVVIADIDDAVAGVGQLDHS